MKASIKFREEQKPLSRAKIPLSILGLPFQSGVVSGSPKELALSLATCLESGPSIKLSYRPNDVSSPFSLLFKTGIGRFGAPSPNSPITMSAEFNLIGSNSGPRFFVHFKPRFGDFSVKRSQSSDFVRSNGGFEMVGSAPETAVQAALGVLRGTEGSARTSFPVVRQAALSFRWGFRVPEAMGKVPVLAMDKISIEHVAEGKKGDGIGEGGDDVVETWQGVKREMEMIRGENAMLRKGIDELRCEFACGKFAVAGGGGERKVKEEREGKEDMKKKGM